MSLDKVNPRGAATNEYITEVNIHAEIHTRSEFGMVFGKLNGNRKVGKIKDAHDPEVVLESKSNDSPIWEQNFGKDNAEARFSYEMPLTSKRTFGNKAIRPGNFADFKHEVVHSTMIDSDSIPILDTESQFRMNKLIPVGTFLNHEKNRLAVWCEKSKEADGIRALLEGASENMLDTANGGLGITLAGASAGAKRSCYNTVVAGAAPVLTTPNFTAATHETNLGTALGNLADNALYQFDLDTHKFMSEVITNLRFERVTVGGKTFRSVCLADPWNINRICQVGGQVSELLKYTVGKENPALAGMTVVEYDEILYIPNRWLSYFRPTIGTGSPIYMPAQTDPEVHGARNTSRICMNVYMGAGALLRGTRPDMITRVSGYGTPDAGMRKDSEVAISYYDGWKRKEWSTKDGTSAILNDSSVVLYCYDKGPGTSYSA